MSHPSEDQKKAIYEGLSEDQKKKQSYTEWAMDAYNNQYENWMPWVEDKYLAWFGTDNKASYATKGMSLCFFYSHLLGISPLRALLLTLRSKDALDKTKVTGISQVDNLQDGVNNLVGGQVGKDGLLAPVGNAVSKEGINRAERGGKDEKGTYGGPAASITDPVAKNAQGAGEGLAGGAQSAGGAAADGAKGVGGYVSGMFGSGGK